MSCEFGRSRRPQSDRYRRRVWWGGSRRGRGMPEPGLLESGSVWATGGRFWMHPQSPGVGEGAIPNGGFRGQLGHSPRFHEGLSCRNSCRSRLLLKTRWVYVNFIQLSVRTSAGMEISMSNANMHCVHSNNFLSIFLHPQQFTKTRS